MATGPVWGLARPAVWRHPTDAKSPDASLPEHIAGRHEGEGAAPRVDAATRAATVAPARRTAEDVCYLTRDLRVLLAVVVLDV